MQNSLLQIAVAVVITFVGSIVFSRRQLLPLGFGERPHGVVIEKVAHGLVEFRRVRVTQDNFQQFFLCPFAVTEPL